MKETISPSDQFRLCAKQLAESLAVVLTRMDERDEVEIEVRTLKAQLEAAEARLEIYQRRYEMTKEMMEPQSSFHLSVMQSEAEVNIDKLRATP